MLNNSVFVRKMILTF